MKGWKWRRLTAAAGVAWIVLSIVAGAVSGSPPKVDASAQTIAGYYTSHHSGILVGAVLAGAAAPLFLVMSVGLGVALREGKQRLAGAVVIVAAATGIALAAVPNAINAGLDQAARGGSPDAIKTGYAIGAYLGEQAFWFAALLAGVAAIAGRLSLPRWYAGVGALTAAFAVLGGISIRGVGFFSPAGATMVFVAFVALLVWALSTSVVLWGTAGVERGRMDRKAARREQQID